MANPWESSSGIAEYPETVRRVLLEPNAFFAETEPQGDIVRPLLFAAISLAIGGAGVIFWEVAIGLLQIVTGYQIPGHFMSQHEQMLDIFQSVVGGVMMPFTGIAAIFVGGAITHGLLLLFNAGGGGYISTVKVLCYSAVGWILCLVPVCGPLVIGPIWSLVIEVVGLVHIHRTTTGPVLAAVFLPAILCCCCLVGLITLAFGLGGAAALAALHHIPQAP